jgi:hypothetical protein
MDLELRFTKIIDLLKEELAKLNKDYIEMQKAFEESSKAANDKENLLTDYKGKIDVLKINQETTALEGMKQAKERENDLIKQLKDYKAEIANLIIDKESLSNEIRLEKEKYDDLFNSKNNLENQLYDFNLKYEKKNNSMEELKVIITKDQLKLKEQSENNEELEQRLRMTNEEVSQLKQYISHLNEDKKKLKLELEDCKSKLELSTINLNTLSEDRAQLKVTLEETTSKLDLANSKANKYEETYKSTMADMEKLSEEMRVKSNTIKTMDEIISKKVNIEKKRNSVELAQAVDESFISKELLIDHIYTLYLQDNSINLQNIVQYLLTNYSIFINTIFQKKRNNPLSLIHEILEDLFFMIYDKGVVCKFSKTNEYKDLWRLNSQEFNNETIKHIANEILNTNSIGFICNIVKPSKSLDDLIQIFITNYHKTINIKSFNLGDYIEKEVKPRVLDKINKNKKSLVAELQTLIEFSISNIVDGKIMYQNKEIYNFKDFYMDSMVDDHKKKKLLNIDYKLHTPEAVDSLAYSLKYKTKELENLYFNSNIENNDTPLMRVIMTILFHIPSLKSISITNSTLNENHIVHIAKLIEYSKNLKTINLSNNSIEDGCVRSICENLKHNKAIVSLNLSNNKLSQNNGFYIADMLMKNNTIDSLYLSGNQINDSGLSTLLTVITNHNHNIRVIDISNNQLNIDDYLPIVDLLVKNVNLFSLNISGNEIFSKSTNMIGHALKSSCLNVLYMNDMKIDEQSFPLLINNLNDSKITVLHVDNNMIGDVVVIFGTILRMNNTLKTLSLRNCSVTSFALMCLCKAFEINYTLEEIRLEENVFDDSSLFMLAKSVARKTVKVYLTSKDISQKVKDSLKEVNNIILI